MKIKKEKYLWVLPVIWMAVIFMFSHQPSDSSAQLSGRLTHIIEAIAKFINIDTEKIDLHLIIRKGAHFTEFAILGFLLFIAIFPSSRTVIKAGIMSQLIGMGYAVLDEVHQLFVPGRSCQVTDMLIDSCGVLFAVLLSYAFVMLKRVLHKPSRSSY